MKLKSAKTSGTSLPARVVRTGLAGLVAVATVAALATGCLDRPVAPSTPTTKNLFVDTVKETAVDKIDLLFMIDNSISMADKQQILASAVPQLVDRLINPIQVCTDDAGATTPANGQPCPSGTTGPTQEFKPVNDIHIGVITSSLGGHGAATNFCNAQGPDNKNPNNNDHAHLLPKVRTGLSSYQSMGFLNFDGTNGATLKTAFTNHVGAAGEQGCGFESSLEAWYRFLVDPKPPQSVTVAKNVSSPTGTDQKVLTERTNFLRSNSLLAVIMLTDEDDCSISDKGLGWLVARQEHMPRATAACAQNPNDKCCRSCALQESSPPSGCTAINVDPACTQGGFTDKQDALNLRCFQQKKRFGLDLLYPTQRYVNALTQLQICPGRADLSCGKNDSPEANPLYTDPTGKGTSVRDPSLVFLAGITGVPWQDIATDATLKNPNALEYKTADELAADGVWADILGDVNAYTKPNDPLMQESVDPRTGSNPITGDALAPPGANANANPINGHEYDIPGRDDLQYACTFPLATPRQNGQDCGNFGQPDVSPNKPLCQNPADNSYGTTQYFAKAYPGLRQLQVLKDYGSNSIVASICPKVTTGSDTDPSFGYNPAVSAIIERLKEVLGGKCLPRKLAPDSTTGLVPCEVVEALPAGSPNAYDCTKKPGRGPLTGDNGTKLEAAVRARLKQDGQCDGAGQPACDQFQMCAITQLDKQTGLNSCLNDDPVKAGVNGYCYIDQTCVDAKTCNGKFISQCPETEKRLLRFVGADTKTPTDGANVFIACAGATFQTGG